MKNKLYIAIYILFSFSFANAQQPCNNETSIAYGGIVYKIHAFGNQCWFKENLNIGTMIMGDATPQNNNKIEKYCYDNEEENCRLYGGLYEWNEIIEYAAKEGAKGICPKGWHIPSDKDFMILESFLGMTQEQCQATGSRGTQAVKILREKGVVAPFDAMLCGNHSDDGNFADFNILTYFWTSTGDVDGKNAIARSLLLDDKGIYRDWQGVRKGYSIRCLKD
jgi:uncharacterized protein (TIGR02145 family)